MADPRLSSTERVKKYEFMKKCSDILSSNIIVSPEEIKPRVDKMYSEIQGTPNQGFRSDEELYHDVVSGQIMEIAASKALMGDLNNQEFVSTNPNSFKTDLTVEGYSFEIKKVSRGDKYLNFNIKTQNGWKDPKGLKRADFTSFMKHHKDIDFLLTGYYQKEEDGSYKVAFKHIINAWSFDIFTSKSRNAGQPNTTTHYYHPAKAASMLECIEIPFKLE